MKYYISLALQQSTSERRTPNLIAVGLIHDAIELFFLAAADFLDLRVKSSARFLDYLDQIESAVSEQKLPFRQRIKSLNELRRTTKHHAAAHENAELQKAVADGLQFLQAASELIFDRTWSSISLVGQIEQKEVREILSKAHELLSLGEWYHCLVECRKAFYVLFEKRSDIRSFKDRDEDKASNILADAMCEAPWFAKDSKYIENHVKEVFDFIVLDYNSLDTKLLKDGINPQAFWNIRRLTPAVYQLEDEWLVQRSYQIEEANRIRSDAEYVFETLVNLVVQREQRQKGERLNATKGNWVVHLRAPGAKVYTKATKRSSVHREVPEHIKTLTTNSATPGIDGDGTYWSVSHFEKDLWIMGYLHESDIDWKASDDEQS
ncbi:MAG: hypothetical protein NXH88_04670 [Hyphomonas sp.]|nr:hypothetical protein [Hyphomonas sp.]